MAAGAAQRRGLAGGQQPGGVAGLHPAAGLPAVHRRAAGGGLHGLLQLRVRDRTGGPSPGRGPRRTAPAQLGTACHPRPAGRERPGQ
ncbi:hypothetical protein G6F59_018046 [Rhizopus arrhizus]|nr:hypothetical protein G6F59_018046 [Rhizopus arrhizus]